QNQLNLTKPQWDAAGFEYKHDYTVIDFPRAVIFRDKYGVQMMMRFNLIHKFSDGTLQQIKEKYLLLSDIEDSVMDPVTHKFNPLTTQVCSSLRSLKSKRTIESRARGSSKRISLGHYPIMLASSYTVKSSSKGSGIILEVPDEPKDNFDA
nr:hypothetical protein [Tanacetum cinerariifolium]